MRFMLILAVVVAGLYVLGLAGADQMAVEMAERDRYCENVRNGTWPDFDRIFSSECQNRR